MTHRSSHVIVTALKAAPDITPVQHDKLVEIERRDQYTILERLYLAWLTYALTGG